MKKVLWWGRFDPDYSRNRILRTLFREQGWEVVNFFPRFSLLASLEAYLRRIEAPDLVWVPCFRQRDLAQAARWAAARQVPLVFDPLISAYDKQVLERGKLAVGSKHALSLLAWERKLFKLADMVLADTGEHARFFEDTFGVSSSKLAVVPVGAEEALFNPGVEAEAGRWDLPEILFFGSFIPLQGPEIIARAASIYSGPPVRWHFVGSGPLLDECKSIAGGLPNVTFTPWVDYGKLPGLIRRADAVLGIFGTTPKAGRVIPNKVYQALACGKPLITRRSPAYDAGFISEAGSSVGWVDAGDAEGLATAVADFVGRMDGLPAMGNAAHEAYLHHFSSRHVSDSLLRALTRLGVDGFAALSSPQTDAEVT